MMGGAPGALGTRQPMADKSAGVPKAGRAPCGVRYGVGIAPHPQRARRGAQDPPLLSLCQLLPPLAAPRSPASLPKKNTPKTPKPPQIPHPVSPPDPGEPGGVTLAAAHGG